MMSRFGLSRRSFLKGLGGVAVALPALEAMNRFGGGRGTARAGGSTIPKRFLISYAGISTGTYFGGSHADRTVPATVGPGYERTRGLGPVFDLGVEGEVSVVSGLLIPHGTPDALPPGGRVAEFHYGPTITPQICGLSATARSEPPRGPTADQLVADVIAGDSPNRVLAYRVQAASYDGSNSTGGNPGRLSWRRNGTGVTAVDPFSSPRLAYESLFTGFTPEDPVEAARAVAMLRRRTSALDLVSESTASLIPKLGAADRRRLEQHFDEIRALETRLQAVDPTAGNCALLPHPGDDPAIGGAIKGDGNPYSESEGYSNEELRAQVMGDLIHMAFVCDLTRSVSYQLTYWKCYMNMFQVTGATTDMHELTHGAGSLDDLSDAVAWHVKHFARLVQKLKDTQEIDGTPILNHCALSLVWEGGHGFDPEGNNANSPHSSENMIVLVAGRAGGLRPGVHIVAPDRHPAEAVIATMNAVGHVGGMGEINGRIEELLGATI